MRKHILLIISILVITILTACANNVDTSVENTGEEVKISVQAINYDDIPWNESIGDFTHDLIITPEMALKLSELYLAEIDPNMLKDKSVSVQTINDSDICIIIYAPYPSKLGGDISIAINLKSGEVLKMWAGE